MSQCVFKNPSAPFKVQVHLQLGSINTSIISWLEQTCPSVKLPSLILNKPWDKKFLHNYSSQAELFQKA